MPFLNYRQPFGTLRSGSGFASLNTEYAISLGCTSLHPYLPAVALRAYYTAVKHRIFLDVIWNSKRAKFNYMKEKNFKIVSKWRFWLSFQFLLIILLNIIGHVREGNTFDRIFGSRLGEAFVGFIGTILGFPSGIYFLFTDDTKLMNTWLHGRFIAYILPAIYYPIFFLSVWYITKQKRNWKLITIGLILFMILSFGGCSRIVEIPLITT